MAAPAALVQAVQAAIVASAHLSAYETIGAAAHACRRLGQLTSGRWRAAARELDQLEEDLQGAFHDAAEVVAQRAESLGIQEEALWTAGDAAGTLDLLRDSALEELEETSLGARALQGQVLFGVSFVEDPERHDRGTTLLFGWPEPLAPARWPWQASWVVGELQGDGDREETLDLYAAGELEIDEALIDALGQELGRSRPEALEGVREAAVALTRASLLAGAAEAEDELEDTGDESGNGEY